MTKSMEDRENRARPQARRWRSNNTVADLAVSKVPQDAQYQLSCVTEIDISLISALLTLQFAALNQDCSAIHHHRLPRAESFLHQK
jgi:hypothetical protein